MTLDIIGDLEAGKRLRGPACDVQKLREDFPALAEQYDRALAAKRYSDAAIAEWITKKGGHLTKNTVLRHRSGQCERCKKTS